jgi:hypothetical protein
MFPRPALLLLCCLCYGQQSAPKLPAWLVPYPGAEPQVNALPEIAETYYTTGAAPEQAISHLRKIFDSAGVPFLPNRDGIGTSIRASVPECDLLIKVRAEDPGSSVRVNCSAKSAVGTPAGGSPITVIETTGTRASAYPRPRPRTFEEAKRAGDEHTRQVLAQAEADHQRRISDMTRFDKPVPASVIRDSFYHQDAPPLAWPAWLVQEGTNQPPKPVAGTGDGKRHLESRYKTSLAMTHLYQFYEALFKANGLRIGTAHLSTGQTIVGNIVQNASGDVEASRSEDGTVNGPATHVKASFHRNYLNEPITVTLRVSVSGSFGHR